MRGERPGWVIVRAGVRAGVLAGVRGGVRGGVGWGLEPWGVGLGHSSNMLCRGRFEAGPRYRSRRVRCT